jgi:hypothetical protein
MSLSYSIYSAVLQALFSLQAFGRFRKKTTKQVADEGHLRQDTAREALKGLEQAGLVGKYPSTPSRQVFLGRKVVGKRTTSYRHSEYASDAARVQRLAQSNVNASVRLRGISLSQLDMRNKTHRSLFNAIVGALERAGHRGLPTYDIVGGSFYWWLTTTSRTVADKVIRQFRDRISP